MRPTWLTEPRCGLRCVDRDMAAVESLTPRRLLVVGELCADIVVRLDSPPRFGQTEHVVPSTTIVLGSSSAITACGAAAMSVPTSMVGVVGDDLLGGFVLRQLHERGVDSASCRVDATSATGTSTILTMPDGDRSILTAMGSIGRVRASDVTEALLTASSHVHVGSYFLQDDLQPDLPDFYRRCRAQGISTSLDPNFDPRESWSSGIADVLPEVDVFFCNEQEASAISGSGDIDGAVDWLARRMPNGGQIVVKKGAEGAGVHLCGPSGPVESATATPAPDEHEIVDTVGAGDSLAAGFLAARLRGLTVVEALRVGVRNGTASTRAAGGVAAQLSWDEVSEPATRDR